VQRRGGRLRGRRGRVERRERLGQPLEAEEAVGAEEAEAPVVAAQLERVGVLEKSEERRRWRVSGAPAGM
jgi:hypothetical protein